MFCLSGLLERVRAAAGGGEEDIMGSSGYIVREKGVLRTSRGSVEIVGGFAAVIDRRAGNQKQRSTARV